MNILTLCILMQLLCKLKLEVDTQGCKGCKGAVIEHPYTLHIDAVVM